MDIRVKLVLAFLAGALVSWLIINGIDLEDKAEPVRELHHRKLNKVGTGSGCGETSKATNAENNSENVNGTAGSHLTIEQLETKINSLEKQKLKQLEQLDSSTVPVKEESKSQYYKDVPSSHVGSLKFEQLGDFRFSMTDLHGELVLEEKDLGWAMAKEQQITTYLYSHRNSGFYVVNRVDCRTTMCEILAVSNTTDNRIWSSVVNGMKQQAWWDMRNTITIQEPKEESELIIMTALYR